MPRRPFSPRRPAALVLVGASAAAAWAQEEPAPTPEPTPARPAFVLIDPTAPETPADDGFDSYDAMGWAVFVAFLVFAGWIVWWFYKKAQEAVGGGATLNSVEEAVFERESVRGVAPRTPDKAPVESPPAPVVSLPSMPAAPAPPAGFPFSPAAAPAPAASDAGADLGRRLQALGVFEAIEGTVPLPVPPDGVIWRLRRGGTALVLPRVESEATLAHLARRFDYVIAPAAGGEALVVRRLESQIGEWTRG